jgi:hypothetical protein
MFMTSPSHDFAEHRRHILLLCAIIILTVFLVSEPIVAQYPGVWGKVDTVTAGSASESHPSLTHNTFQTGLSVSVPVIFERRTGTESQIVVKHFSGSTLSWDSSETIISSSPLEELQTLPDFADVPGQYGSTRRGLAVWQRWKGGRWQIYHSMLSAVGESWTAPAPLVSDTVSSIDSQVRPCRDSVFVVTWKRGDALVATRVSSAGAAKPDTVAVSDGDSLQYDVCSLGGLAHVAWTAGVPPEVMIMSSHLSLYDTTGWSSPETTITHLAKPPNPHLTIFLGSHALLYEQELALKSDIIFTPMQFGAPANISSDPSATDINAQGFQPPMTTKRSGGSGADLAALALCVYEKYRSADSMLVFLTYSSGDTVRSPGYNRNARVGSQFLWYRSGANMLIVWESNRSGHSHIYSRTAWLYFDEVEEKADTPLPFRLQQNYPNPFNPTTVVRYQLPVVSSIRISVFDLLGRELTVLVDEVKQPGEYEVTFDGNNLANGVYLCRMQAEGYVSTRKLLLLR